MKDKRRGKEDEKLLVHVILTRVRMGAELKRPLKLTKKSEGP